MLDRGHIYHMAKLPTRDDLGGLPSARTGRVVSSWDASPLRQGNNAMMRAYENLGGALSKVSDGWAATIEKQEAHDAEMRFQQLQFDADKDYENATFNTGRDELHGFTAATDDAFKTRSDEYLNTLPPGLREEMGARIMASRRARYKQSATWQKAQQTNLSLADHDRLDLQFNQQAATMETSEELSALAGEAVDRIVYDPHLSQAQKEIRLQKTFSEMSTAFFNGRIQGGHDISAELQSIRDAGRKNPMLRLMDKREGDGNYDTLLGHAQKKGKAFAGFKASEKTIGFLKHFTQKNGKYAQYSKPYVDKTKGNFSTPLGRYQIVGSTMAQAAKEMGLPDDTVFSKKVQDAMFQHLVKQRLAKSGTMEGKRAQLRAEWEGFIKVSDPELDSAIRAFESGKGGNSPLYSALSTAQIAAFSEKNKSTQLLVVAHRAGQEAYDADPENALTILRKNKKLTPEQLEKGEERVRRLQKDAEEIKEANVKEIRQGYLDEAANLPVGDIKAQETLLYKVRSSSLPGDTKAALETFISNGPKTTSSSSTIRMLNTLMYSDPKKFADPKRTDLTAHIFQLSTSDFQTWMKRQADAGKPGATTKLSRPNQKVDLILNELGSKPSTRSGAKLKGNILTVIAPQIEEWERDNGKKIDDVSEQKIIDNAFRRYKDDDDWTETTPSDVYTQFQNAGKKVGFTRRHLLDAAVKNLLKNDRVVDNKGLMEWLGEYMEAYDKNMEGAE